MSRNISFALVWRTLYALCSIIVVVVATATATATAAAAATATAATKQQHRIAILVPYLSNSHPILPTYFPLFLQSAQGLSPLIDFLIFHNGQLTPLIHYDDDDDDQNNNTTNSTKHQGKIIDMDIPDNVQFIDLQNSTYFATHLLQIMDIKIDDNKNDTSKLLPNHDYQSIYSNYPKFLQSNPYVLIEVKPALGYIFRNYIPQSKYTHWGYSDLDIYFGDLQSWITKDELNNYDIVTYGFGDQNRVYLRGQFTFHKNDVDEGEGGVIIPVVAVDGSENKNKKKNNNNKRTKGIYKLWTKCDYLYNFDTRFMKLLWHKKFRLQSAEGCYSSVVVSQSREKKLRVKYAVKAWTNPKAHEGMNTYGVSAVFMNSDGPKHQQKGLSHERSIIFKKSHAASGSEYLNMVSKINSKSVFNSTALLPLPMQWEVGDMEPVSTNKDIHCMGWAPKQHQHNLCIDPKYNVQNYHTIYLIGGRMYKRRFEERKDLFFTSKTADEEEDEQLPYPVLESRPIFHAQEWKRKYRSTQLSSMKIPKKDILGWTFYPEGAIPLFDKKKTAVTSTSTTTKLAKHQIADDEKYFLPSQAHCFILKKEKKKGQFKDYCKWSVSWYHNDVVTVEGPDWKKESRRNTVDTSITLSLTLGLTISPDNQVDKDELESMMKVIDTNISIWKDQPWILFLCIIGSDTDFMAEHIIAELSQSIESSGSTKYLIGVLVKETEMFKDNDGNTIHVNRNALLNLAEAASFTRWTISGLDIENKRSVLSKDAIQFAEMAVANRINEHGQVFVIPDFHFVDNSSSSKATKSLSLVDLYDHGDKKKIKATAHHSVLLDGHSKTKLISRIEEDIYALWLSYTKQFQSASNAAMEATAKDIASRLDKVHVDLSQLMLNEYMDEMRQSSNVLLMVDKFSPNNGILTEFTSTEIDELGSCYKIMRLVQFALLNYKIQPLAGVFSTSIQPQASQDFCTKSSEDILKEERNRMAKLMILQEQ